MNAIDNSNLLNIFGGQTGVIGFVPAGSYTYNLGTATVVVTMASTLPSGDTLVRTHVQVFDKFGGEIRAEITTLGGAATIDVTSLNRSEPLDIKVTVITTQNRVADGGAYNILPAGVIGHWDIEKKATAQIF